QTLNGLFICFAYRPLGPLSGFLTIFCVAPTEVYSFGQNLSSAILSLSEVYRWNLKELLPNRATTLNHCRTIETPQKKCDAWPPRQALISTSTPDGRSSLDKASTVREDDV